MRFNAMMAGGQDYRADGSVNPLRMDQDRDLLPWIMGGLFAIAGALAVAVASSHHPVPIFAAAAAPPSSSMPSALPLTPQALTQPAIEAPAAPTAATPASAAATPRLPSGQVWECVVNGQHTFASAPCGPNASIRQLSVVNTMEASPLYRAAPDYATEPSEASEWYPQSGPVEVQAPVVVAGAPRFYGHRRHDHTPPPRQPHPSPRLLR